MKKIGGIIVLTIILMSGVTLFVKANHQINGKTTYVDDDGGADYTNIQDAIDNASDGDTIFVYNGTYFENLIINKSINLTGENSETTIIDGTRTDNTVHITAENVTISGFTITNGSRERWFYAGLRLTSSNNIIHGNIIKNNMLGIFGKKVTNITIYDNHFFGDGVTFSLYDSGIESVPYCEKYFVHNVYNNTVNTKELYYYKNQRDFVVPKDAGQVIAVSCINMTISHANLTNADYGCIFVNCSDCEINNSNISYGDGMLWLINSRKNKIQNNQITHNFEGICIDCGSKRNKIQYNNISHNEYVGIIIEDGSNCNTIFRNNFIKNNQKNPIQQAYFMFCFINRWKQNYWNRAKILPKVIYGRVGKLGLIPWVNFDWRPALKPYKI